MKQNVWILNHYATSMFVNKSGRHYLFSKFLKKAGYKPTIFCASTIHRSNDTIDLSGKKYLIKETTDGFNFVFIKATTYKGNGVSRIRNMISFAWNLYRGRKDYAKKCGTPNVILASSVHPLTLIAGIYLAKYFKIKCICEIRDLWPESLIEYGIIKKASLIARFLYIGEQWIYKQADALIFTMEGGQLYLQDKKWDINNGGNIDLKKVYHINNGIDLEDYNFNLNNYMIDDRELSNNNLFKVIYTGAISQANHIEILLDTAQYLYCYDNIKIIVYGDGTDLDKLREKVNEKKLNNIVFKGHIDKKYIPYVLSKADVNFFHMNNSNLIKYGYSLNKSFDYLASGKPIIVDVDAGDYDYILKNRAGIYTSNNAKDIADTIFKLYHTDKKEIRKIGINARKLAYSYDFKLLTDKLINIIEDM